MSGRSTPSTPRDWTTGRPKSGRSGGVRPLRLPLPGRGCHRGPSRRVGPAAGGDDGADRRGHRGVGRALRGATRRHRLLSAARDRHAALAAPFDGETSRRRVGWRGRLLLQPPANGSAYRLRAGLCCRRRRSAASTRSEPAVATARASVSTPRANSGGHCRRRAGRPCGCTLDTARRSRGTCFRRRAGSSSRSAPGVIVGPQG